MKKKINIGTLLINIICALLLAGIVACQFIPFWTVLGENADTASLIGVTGRQYVHGDLIEQLGVIADGFTYHDISVQVLLTIVLGVFAVLSCVRNSHGWFRILLVLAVAGAGISLWLTVPAFTLGQLGNVLMLLNVALAVVAILMAVLFVMEKQAEKKERETAK